MFGLIAVCLLSQIEAGAVVYTADTAQISAAHDGATICLSGDLEVDGPLKISANNLRLNGLGHAITQLAEDSPTLVIIGRDVAVSNLRLVGRGTERPWEDGATSGNKVAGILIRGSGAIVRDCRLTNHAGGSIVLDGPCDGTLLDHCIVRGCAGEIKYGDNGQDAAIKGTSSSVAKRQITISRCDLAGHCFGVLIPGDCRMVCDATHIHDIPGQHGVYLTRGGDLVLSACLVTDCAMCGVKLQHQLAENTDAVATISGNTVSRCGELGIGAFTVDATNGQLTNVAILSNNVDRCGKLGIYIRRCEGVAVIANRIHGCQTGLWVRDSSGTITPNAIHDCLTPIQLDSQSAAEFEWTPRRQIESRVEGTIWRALTEAISFRCETLLLWGQGHCPFDAQAEWFRGILAIEAKG